MLTRPFDCSDWITIYITKGYDNTGSYRSAYSVNLSVVVKATFYSITIATVGA